MAISSSERRIKNVQILVEKDAVEARKLSVKNFNQVEKNCNTCKKLERVKHDKRGGFLKGKCEAKGLHSFHPDDPMFMECWEERE